MGRVLRSGDDMTWRWVQGITKCRDRLRREVVIEVIITTDRLGNTRCTMSALDEDAPLGAILEGLVASARQVMDQAEKLADAYGARIDVSETGKVTVSAKIVPGKENA